MGAVVDAVSNAFTGGYGGAILGAAGSLLGGGSQGRAAGQAAGISAEAMNRALGLQKEAYDKQLEWQKPYYNAGVTGLNALIPLSTNYQKFGMDQFQQDPGYAFRLSEGLKALNNNAAARGGLISGAALKAAQRYGQDAASQEYQKAFDRYQTERNAQLQPLQYLTGLGYNSANSLGSAAQNYANSSGNLITGNAATQGNALLAQGNARASQYGSLASGIGSIVDSYFD